MPLQDYINVDGPLQTCEARHAELLTARQEAADAEAATALLAVARDEAQAALVAPQAAVDAAQQAVTDAANAHPFDQGVLDAANAALDTAQQGVAVASNTLAAATMAYNDSLPNASGKVSAREYAVTAREQALIVLRAAIESRYTS